MISTFKTKLLSTAERDNKRSILVNIPNLKLGMRIEEPKVLQVPVDFRGELKAGQILEIELLANARNWDLSLTIVSVKVAA